MNILIPHSWLKQFLKTEVNPQKIASCLSLSGPSVEKLNKAKNDYVYDIEVTTNRVDMMSVQGIAREAAAILPQFDIKAKLSQDIYQPTQTGNQSQLPPFPLKIKVSNSQLCPRFTAVIIDNVAVKPAPKNTQSLLEKSGIRSINNIVDISNYLMRAYGQPVHTFDLDKIKQTMHLRLSKKGEKITTLDQQTFSLTNKDIVIQDSQNRLIDLCGIMGGQNTAVDENTTRVLLFVQTYNPVNIRHTSMRLGQRSEAAQLFEKNLDPQLVLPVLNKGIQLFKQWANGEQGSQIIDLYPQPVKTNLVIVPLQLIKERLGIDIPLPKIKTILNSLGFDLKLDPKLNQNQLKIKVPSWRTKDVSIPEDIIEELARIHGYHRLPSQLMATPIPTDYPTDNFNLEHQLKDWLAGFGLNELYTNSLISQELVNQSHLKQSNHLKIKNALSEEWQFLRRSLIPSHLQALNQNPNQKSISFFEIANTYVPKTKALPEEQLQLIISTTNDYAYLKGIVASLMQKLHLQPTYKPDKKPLPIWIKHQQASILINNQSIGAIGAVKLPADFHHTQAYCAILSLKPLFKLAKLYPHYQPISSYSPIIEDLTFTLPERTTIGSILETIKKTHKLIAQVKHTKVYHQNHTFNLTYQSHLQSLNDNQIKPIRKKIVQILKQKFQAKLVGKLE